MRKIVINGIETNYSVSEMGEVRNDTTGRYLNGTTKRNEYKSVQLTIGKTLKTVMVHRLVAEAYIPNPKGYPIVLHINGDSFDNRVKNLKWGISSEVRQNPKGIFSGKDIDYESLLEEENIEWRPIKGFEERFLISNNGVVKYISTNEFLTGSIRNGYIRASLDRKAKSVHRLEWEAFMGDIPKGYVIDHIDGNKQNNHLSNLRCVSQSENMRNAQKNGHKGQKKVAQYDLENNFIAEYNSFTEAAKAVGVTYSAISSAARRNGTSSGYRWKIIED